jgi:hypothetical protein
MTITDQPTASRLLRAVQESLTFDEFLRDNPSRDEFERSYAAADPSAAEVDRLVGLAPSGGLVAVAIVEHWCPDVVASLPFVQKLAERAGPSELRLAVVVRDASSADLAAAYAPAGVSRIPTYVLVTADGRELGVLVERTAAAQAVVDALQAEFAAEHGLATGEGFFASLDDDLRAQYVARARERRHATADAEHRSLAAAFAELLG